MPPRVQIAIDCLDPAASAAFWAEALGYVEQPPPDEFASWDDFLRANDIPESEWNAFNALIDPEGSGPRLFFQRVPEPKQGKSRIHLDLGFGGGLATPADERRTRVDDAVARLVALGAEHVKTYEERGERWVAMRDPEGIEFDVQ
jgi:catechol 2,3-dioxygenase-like lactoylglutathione lyase family enzyme